MIVLLKIYKGPFKRLKEFVTIFVIDESHRCDVTWYLGDNLCSTLKFCDGSLALILDTG